MAKINPYDQPAQAQFMNTYVPIPFQEMLAAGQMKQERYDKASDATDSMINRVEMINAIPNSPDERRKKETINTIYEIRDKYYGKDLSDPFVQRELSNEIRSRVDSNWIKKAEASYSKWNAAQQSKRALEMNNKWNPLLDKDPASKWDSKHMGEYNYNPRAYVGIAEMFEPYYKDIKPDALDVVNKGGIDYMREYVSDAQIADVTRKSAQELASTTAGQGQIELYRMSHPDTKLDEIGILQEIGKEFGMQKRYSQYQPLPENLQGGRGLSSGVMTDDTEVKAIDGQPADTSKPLSGRKWTKEEKKLEDTMNNPNLPESERIKAKNSLIQIKEIEEGVRQEAKTKIASLYEENIPVIQDNVTSLFKDFGKSEEDAKAFINDFIEQSNISDLLGGQRFLYSSGLNKVINTRLSNQLRWDLQDELDTKNLPEYKVKEIEKSVEKFINSQFDIHSDNADKVLEKKNALLPTQTTSTVMNQEYRTDSSGRVMYDYKEVVNGKMVEQEATSSIWASIKDNAHNPGDYMHTLDKVDKKTSIKTLEKIQKALDEGDSFTIDRISDRPTDTGNPVLKISIINKDSNGKTSRSGTMDLILPGDLFKNNKAYKTELTRLGKHNLVYNLDFAAPIRETLTSNDWEVSPTVELPINEGGDSIKVVKEGTTFSVYVTSPENDIQDQLYKDGIRYHELAEIVNEDYYNITDSIGGGTLKSR